MAPITIENLNTRSEWLDLVAKWHHSEWLRGRLKQNIDLEQQDSHFSRRVSVLKAHLDHDFIPVTFLAVCNGRPVGSVSIVYYQFTQDQVCRPWVTNVYVEPSYRKQGIGTQLVQYACEYASQHGVKKLMLYTHDREHFYQKRGWIESSKSNVQGQDVTVFYKRFSSVCT